MTVTSWCDCMKRITGLDLPWRTMRTKLVKGVTGDLTMVRKIWERDTSKNRVHVCEFMAWVGKKTCHTLCVTVGCVSIDI